MKKRVIAVIDLKAFYSFVECVDRGLDPWSVPLVVADKERGKNTIVLSVTPYLKKRGVPSRLRINDLPEGYEYIYAVPRMSRYVEMSVKVTEIMMDFVSEEDIHVYSIDEAFMDLTSYLSYYRMTSVQLVKSIIRKIREETGLEATGGIGDNFFLAKVSLDLYAKKEPDGIAVLHEEDVKEKLWPVTPLSRIWGIAERTEARLNSLGMTSVKDVALANRDFMKKKFGIIGDELMNHANGLDDSDIHEIYVPEETSFSIGQTLFKDYDRHEIITVIRELNDDLCMRLRDKCRQAGTVFLYIGYSGDKGGFARQMSLLRHTDNTRTLFEAVMEIFSHYVQNQPIRGVSIAFGKLRLATHHQVSLFEDGEKEAGDSLLDRATDIIRKRFGLNAVLRASSLLGCSTVTERHSQIGGHRR